jgi:hypothetical protein
MKLQKLKLQGPSLARDSSQALGRPLAMSPKCPETLQLMNLDRGFPTFNNNSKNLHAITNNELRD